jgi:hypothetical protein
LFCLKFLVLFSLVETFNALCLALDHLLFPGHRRVEIREPVFLIGNPRSGTTILHRVMARDEERFFCYRFWEIVFPSILQKRFFAIVGRLDRMLGSRGRAAMERGEAKRLAEFSRAHPTGWFLPEEDDKILIHILAGTDLVLFFPYAGFDRLAKMDVALVPEDQRQIMAFYTSCVRRQAYFKGGSRQLLSKNPVFAGKVESLLQSFPDCKMIYLVRNPLDVVPSTISLTRTIVKMLGVSDPPDVEERVYDLVKFYYTYPLERLDSLPQNRFIVVNYEELLHDPKQTIEKVYDQLGLALSPHYEHRLEEEAAKMKEFKSSHKYMLPESGVTHERIVSELKHIFKRFGFDTREAP